MRKMPVVMLLSAALLAQQPSGIGYRKVAKEEPTQDSLLVEMRSGAMLAQQFEKQYVLERDPKLLEYVNRIGQNASRNSDTRIPCFFTVVKTESPALIVLPGGRIYITTGALARVSTEARLASLLSHAVAHVAYRDHARLGANPAAAEAAKDELTTHTLGLEYLYKTGYDPNEYLPAFRSFDVKEISQLGGQAQNHFDTASFAADLRTLTEKLPVRQAYLLSTSEFSHLLLNDWTPPNIEKNTAWSSFRTGEEVRYRTFQPPPSAVSSASAPVVTSSDPDLERQLLSVKRIYVDSFGDDAVSKQIQAMVLSTLTETRRFIVTENKERADAILRGSGLEKDSQEFHSYSEGTAAGSAGGGFVANRSSASGSFAGAHAAIEDSGASTETIHDARVAVRLVNRDGDVLWATTQESKGAKYKGASADVAEKVVKELLRALDKLASKGVASSPR